MAIHIDIYAHLRDRELVKEGERILRLVDYYEREANQRAVRGAQGRSKAIVAAQDKHDAAFDQSINTIDDFRNAVNAAGAAQRRLTEIQETATTETYTAEKKTKDLRQAEVSLARAMQTIIYKGQALTKAVNTETRAKANLNEENAKHTKNAREVTRVTNVNRKELTKLSRTTNKLRRDVESLHSANVTIFQDNKKITKSMEGLTDATKRTTRARERYNETRKKEGVTGKEIKAAGRELKDALEAEARKARDVSDILVETIEHRRDHDDAVNRNSATLNALAINTGKALQESDRLRAANSATIDQNLSLTRTFDRVGEATKKAYREYTKFDEMSQDTSVSGAALQAQFNKTNDAFEAHAKTVSGAKKALEDYYASVDEAEKKQARKRRMELIGKQSAAQWISRNVGALTPLGTVSPGALAPLIGILGTVGDAAVTASQSLALLPAGVAAAAAGIGTLAVGMKGFGDALTSMGDPKKFAEALYLLSPNAQQAALAIKSLVDGPLGDLKRATQDALFVNVGGTIEKLTQALGPSIQRMTTSIATSFNQMFNGISFEMMTPGGAAQLGTITTNIASMFDRLIPAVTAFNSAFMKIAETGSGFLPKLADSLTSVMTKFDAFISKAQADGSLQNFMQKGIDAVAAISKWLLKFGQDIYKVFGDKSPEEFMKTLESLESLVTGLFGIFSGFAAVLREIIPVFTAAADAVGGWENAMWGLLAVWGIVKAAKIAKFVKEIADAFDVFGSAATKAGGASMAGMAAGAKSGTKATTGVFAAAGTASGKNFGGALTKSLKVLPWVTLGAGIAELISQGIRDGAGGWRDALAKGLDPNFILNPVEWMNTIRAAMGKEPLRFDDKGFIIPGSWPAPPAPPSKDSFYEDWYPAGVDPAGPGPMDPGYEFPLPNVPLDENGKALTDSEILNKIRGELLPGSYAVDPFTDPITGQKLNPMLPIGPNGMPEYPAGGVPGTPSIRGPIMPQYNSFGQVTGYGANMVDPEEVFDAQLGVLDKARDLEEAKKDLLAAQQAGILSAEEVNDLERKVMDEKLSLHKALVQLGKAQTGDVEKLKTATNSVKDALGDFGAEIDKDFGISKGLSGIAENLTKFLANLAFAPAFGAIRGTQAGLGFPNGEGVGSGLAGMVASSMGYYKGGPMDTASRQPSGYAPSGYTPSYFQPVGPQSAGVGFGSGPGVPNVSKSDIKGINLSTIPVAAQKYANNCIDAAAQIILSANGVQLTQDAIENTIKRGGSIDSLAAGLNRLDPSGGYVAMQASGGSPEALLTAVQNSINRGNGSILNVAPGSSIAGRNYPSGHFIAVTGYDPATGRINLSDTADGSMYSVTAAEAFQSSRGRGLVAGMGLPATPAAPLGPIYGPPLPKYASGGEVPIMAHSGEHVLTRDDVAALGGQAGVYRFRRSLHSYEQGGPIQPTDLGGLLGVDSPPASTGPQPPKPPAPPAPPALPAPPPPSVSPAAPAAPGLLAAEVPALAQLPETALPGGIQTPGSVIGAQVEAPAGYGEGFSLTGSGLLGMAQSAAASAAAAGGAMGGGGGGPAAAAALQMAMELMNRGIEYAGQVAAIGAQGLLETFLPAGGSELAQNNWATRWLGGIAGAAPAIANLAGGASASNQGVLAGVGGPPTPEQIAAQGMDPNRAQHTGAGAPAGPYTGVNIQNYVVTASEDRAGQDLARYQPAPGMR